MILLARMEYEDLFGVVEEIEGLIRQGYDKVIISKKFKGFSNEAFSVAKARIKNAREKKVNPDFLFNEDDLRFCTNQKIAEYRAERLKCAIIVDIGSGVGVQAVEFAKKCGKVIAVEIDKRKVEFSKINANVSGVSNIEFVNDDVLIALEKIGKADVIFWDPERPSTEKERGLDSFVPKFDVLIKKAGLVSENIVIELPPQMDRSKVKDDCEFEYVSLDGHLNRLNVYFGGLKKCFVSVVSLPSGERLEFGKEKFDKPFRSKLVKKFLFEFDDGLLKSGLSDFFVSKIDGFLFDFGGKIYLTSDVLLKSGFLRSYTVISSVELKDLSTFLVKNGFGKVVLHGRIDDKKYFSLKTGFEKGLKGEVVAHVFLDDRQAIVTVFE